MASLQAVRLASRLAEQAIGASSVATGAQGARRCCTAGLMRRAHKEEAAGRFSMRRANRMLVKALMSQASICKRLRRPEEALLVARQAAVLDGAVEVHVQMLELELAKHEGLRCLLITSTVLPTTIWHFVPLRSRLDNTITETFHILTTARS